MKKNILNELAIIMAIFMSVNCVSCGDNEEQNSSQENTVPTTFEKSLFNTSWKLEKSITHFANSTVDNLQRFPQFKNSVITFSELNEEGTTSYQLYLDGQHVGYWYNRYWEDEKYINILFNLSPSDNGLYRSVFNSGRATKNGNTLQIRLDLSESYDVSSYTRTSTPNLNTGGNNSSYEKPEIGFDSFSATKSSITVKYRIYNKEKAAITSCRIYYGTTTNPTSSVNATISGVFITVTISGLKNGTEYYVRCKATGGGGSTTTDVTKCITNY